jgi:hypothetical protein
LPNTHGITAINSITNINIATSFDVLFIVFLLVIVAFKTQHFAVFEHNCVSLTHKVSAHIALQKVCQQEILTAFVTSGRLSATPTSAPVSARYAVDSATVCTFVNIGLAK